MIKVIDVSEHNGTIDWTKVKLQISGVIIRLGYGSDQANQDDKQWARNVSECERLGIPWGAYLYSYANTADKIRSEIAHAKRLLSGHKPQLPVFYDLEERRYKETWGEAAGMWCKEIRAAEYIDGLYSWAWAINGSMPACASAYWVADYGINDGNQHTKPTLTGGRQLTAWQYTSKGRCAGISSSGLDVSEFYVDYSKGKTTVTPTPQPTTPAAAPSGSTLDLAVAVMQGKYGTGDTRKAKLGTRYTEVQNFLNHIADASAATLAAEVKAGKYGNGDVRKVVLGSKYNAVMAIINAPVQKKPQIAVDGKLGPATIKAWQSRLGVTADGVMGPDTIRAIQRWAGSTADGIMGPNTRKAVQRKLGVSADGVWGLQTIKALQTWLNS